MDGLESGLAWYARAAGRYLVMFLLVAVVVPAIHREQDLDYGEVVVFGGVLAGLLGVLPSLGALAFIVPMRTDRWAKPMATAALCTIGAFLAFGVPFWQPWLAAGVMGFQLFYGLVLLPAPLVREEGEGVLLPVR